MVSKKYWLRIFKFINFIRRLFSKSKNGDKKNLGNMIDEKNKTQSLIGKKSGLSLYVDIGAKPKNMEEQSVIKQENSMQ